MELCLRDDEGLPFLCWQTAVVVVVAAGTLLWKVGSVLNQAD